jgi:hypothetical protein
MDRSKSPLILSYLFSVLISKKPHSFHVFNLPNVPLSMLILVCRGWYGSHCSHCTGSELCTQWRNLSGLSCWSPVEEPDNVVCRVYLSRCLRTSVFAEIRTRQDHSVCFTVLQSTEARISIRQVLLVDFCADILMMGVWNRNLLNKKETRTTTCPLRGPGEF